MAVATALAIVRGMATASAMAQDGAIGSGWAPGPVVVGPLGPLAHCAQGPRLPRAYYTLGGGHLIPWGRSSCPQGAFMRSQGAFILPPGGMHFAPGAFIFLRWAFILRRKIV